MTKQVLYGAEARAAILAGAKKISDMVRITFGPLGRNVIISQSALIDYNVHSLPTHVSKDGYTVARCFDVNDYAEKVGVNMIKECTRQTVDHAGDGTTLTTILAYAILEKGIELINAGANPIQLKKGIDKAVEYVVEELKKMAIQVGDDNEKLFQIATISANNDETIGRLISDAFQKIGNDGVIDIEESKSHLTEVKIADGFKIERGWLTPLFVTNMQKGTCEFSNPVILMYQNRITHHTQFEKAFTLINVEQQKTNTKIPIVIICEDADGEGLATLARNVSMGNIQCCVIKAPSFGDERRQIMEDLALVTGGKYISDLKGVGIKEIDYSYFGQADKVIISKDETVFIGGKRNETKFAKHITELESVKNSAQTDEEKQPIEKRVARLNGGVAVVYVGGGNETEMKERKDRFDDAIKATKSAIAEGYVAGGGYAFLRIINKVVKFISAENLDDALAKIKAQPDEDKGNAIVVQVLEVPFQQLCLNAGIDYKIKLKEVYKSKLGYNVKTEQVENLIESGVIDPVKVLRCAIQNAAASAGIILTAEGAIIDIP